MEYGEGEPTVAAGSEAPDATLPEVAPESPYDSLTRKANEIEATIQKASESTSPNGEPLAMDPSQSNLLDILRRTVDELRKLADEFKQE